MPSFIEANLMPGLSNHGYLTRCFALNESISYKDMILSIAGLGFGRANSIPARETATPVHIRDLTAPLIAANTVLK